MKAVLVGGVGDDKVYYVIDAVGSSNDGAIVSPDGKVIMIRFFSWASKNPSVRKIRNTKFHRLLWDSPIDPMKGKWFEIFVQKTQEIDKEVLDGVVIKTDLHPSGKTTKKKIDRIQSFLSTKNGSAMILSDKTLFKNDDKRRAWVAIKLFQNYEDTK